MYKPFYRPIVDVFAFILMRPDIKGLMTHWGSSVRAFVLGLGLLAFGLGNGFSVRVVQAASLAKPVISQSNVHSALPSSFIANAGQVDAAVRFQVKSQIGTLSFTPSGVTLDLAAAQSPAPPSATPTVLAPDSLAHLRPDQPGLPAPSAPTSVAVQLGFIGENPNVLIDGADPLPGIANFFIGNDSTQWHTNVPTYAGVTYHELYPGIDLQYTGQARLLKGTYTVAPNVDPSLIRWRYSGADNLMLDAVTGDLHISAPDNIALTEQVPAAWQTRADGSQAPVTVRYALNADDSVQFVTGDYDHALPLVIDPGLVYSTYLGGTADDIGDAIALDGTGNAYVAGSSTGSFPTTAGTFQTGFAGGWDAFVVKVNPTGTALLFSTYIGGSGSDWSSTIKLDGSGDIYLSGYLNSPNFPTTPGAYQTTLGGSFAAYVTKFNSTATALIFSTYIGGTALAIGTSLAVDSSGNSYVCGWTTGGLPTTAGAVQLTYGGGIYDGFVAKLNATGTAVGFLTYLGGSGVDESSGIAVDNSANIYVSGQTAGGFPVTAGVYQTTYGGGTSDSFVAKLNSSGNMIYSTYIGGSGDEFGGPIAVDSAGEVFVANGSSGSYPTTAGAFQTVYGGGLHDGYITKLNVSGTALIYSTYFGGTADDFIESIVLDAAGNAYVWGFTASADFPVTVNAYRTTKSGAAYDTFVSEIDATSSNLLYSTYLGAGIGVTLPYAGAIALGSNGDIYITTAHAAGFPTTAGGYQPAFGGGTEDAVVAELSLPPTIIPTSTPIPVPPATAAPLIDDPIEFDYTANQTTVIAAGNPGSDGGNNDDIALDVTLHNISSRPVTGLVLREQIQPALQIVGITSTAGTPTTNCDQITVVIGTLLPGQTALLTVQTQVSNTAALAPNASNLQPVMYTYADTNDAFSRSRHFVAPVLSLVNVGSASWDDQHYRTKVQIVRVLRPSALPSTGEHPAEFISPWLTSTIVFAVFGLIGLGLWLVTRKLRAHSS